MANKSSGVLFDQLFVLVNKKKKKISNENLQ